MDNWGAEFRFTAAQLGAIGGAGFSGFCFGIIIGGVVCDKIGYSKLVIAAFALHVLSAFVTFTAKGGAGPAAQQAAYNSLYWGMFIFACANGTLEAVANPLVATPAARIAMNPAHKRRLALGTAPFPLSVLIVCQFEGGLG